MRIILQVFAVSVLVLSGVQLFSQTFSAARPLATSMANAARTLEVGDLDGDGDIDILIGADNHVSYYLNDGTGLFGEPVRLDGSFRAFQIKLVDVDADGAVDITWANWLNPNLAWARNLGNGQFAPAAAIGLGGMGINNATSIDWADANEDGLPDLFTSSYGLGTSHYFTNLGNGTFGPAQSLAGTTSAWTCAAGDIDGDGDIDALVGGASLGWRRGINGDYGILQPYNTNIGGTAGVRHLLFHNVDGDPPVEFYIAEPSIDRIARYDHTAPSEPFTSQTLSSTATGVSHLCIGDLDGDGTKDLLAACTGSNSVLIFPSCLYQLPLLQNVQGVVATAMADLDLDGLTDVVTLSNTSDELAIHRQLTPFVFAPPYLLTPIGGGLTEVVAADIDNDGKSDVVLMYSGSHHLIWKQNQGGNTFGELIIIDDDVSGVRKVLAGDMDGDGDVDLVLSVEGERIQWYQNNGSGVFSAPIVIAPDFGPGEQFEIIDADGDGDLDLLAYRSIPFNLSIVLFLNDGTGNMGSPQSLVQGQTGMTIPQLGDVDDDGDMDLIYRHQQLMLCLNEGGLVFGPPVEISGSATYANLYITDLNNDGYLDLILRLIESGVRVQWGMPGAAFSAAAVLIAEGVNGIVIHDLDDDGDQDILGGMDDGRTLWWRNDGNGVLSIADATQNLYGDAAHLALGDLDGDGDVDLIVGTQNTDRVAWFENFVGTPYRIEGHVYYDLDGSGSRTPGDPGFPYASVSCSPDATVPFTIGDGSYEVRTDAGPHTVLAIGVDPFWEPISMPAAQQVTVDDAGPIATGIDFGYIPMLDTLVVDDTWISGIVRCGQPYERSIDLRNRGTVTADLTVHLYLNDLDEIADMEPLADSVEGGHLTWSFQMPPLSMQHIDVISQVDAQFGTILIDSMVVEMTASTGYVSSVHTAERTVLCSYDPNDKQVSPIGHGPHHAIAIDTDELQYTIRFQNTGNEVAFNVMLRDRLDPYLDPSTVRLLGTSHPISDLYYDGIDGDLVVRYDNIMLPDSVSDPLGSQGYVVFAIAPAVQPISGTIVSNSVDIYFDINPPVTTNTVHNTFIDCGLAIASIISEQGGLQAWPPGEAYQWFWNDEPIAGATDMTYQPMESGFYTVRITDVYGCEPFSEPYQVIVTSTSAQEKKWFGVFPNPTSGLITVLFPDDRAIPFMEVYNAQGALMDTFSGSRELDLAAYPDGLYILRALVDEVPLGNIRLVLQR